MKLILETINVDFYLTTSREYYLTVDRNEELIVLRDRLKNLQDWVYTLPCAERLGIVQRDAEGNRLIVSNNRVSCKF